MLVWTCAICHEEIADGTGTVSVDSQAAEAWEEREVARVAEMLANGVDAGAEVAALVIEPVCWIARHGRCGRAEAYSIEVGDLRDGVGLLERTAELVRQPWLWATDWDVVLGTIAAGYRLEHRLEGDGA